MDILGKPVAQDLHYACEAARLHVLRRPFKMIGLASVIKLSNIATRDAFHLLFQLLTFNPVINYLMFYLIYHFFVVD